MRRKKTRSLHQPSGTQSKTFIMHRVILIAEFHSKTRNEMQSRIRKCFSFFSLVYNVQSHRHMADWCLASFFSILRHRESFFFLNRHFWKKRKKRERRRRSSSLFTLMERQTHREIAEEREREREKEREKERKKISGRLIRPRYRLCH